MPGPSAGSPHTPKRPRPSSQLAGSVCQGPEQGDADSTLGVHMAVHFSCGRVGLAWYDPSTAELRCMEGADEATGPLAFRLVQLAKLHVDPAVVYLSSKADPALVAVLTEQLPGWALGEAPRMATGPAGPAAEAAEAAEAALQPGGPVIRQEKASLFHPTHARRCFEAVHVAGMPPGLPPRDRLHLINTMVSLSAEQQVCAAGALLAVLTREGLLAEDPTAPSGTLPLASLAEAPLAGHLLVDPASMQALHIFREEAHPSAMGLGRPKEGLSVFGVMNRCVSPPGKRMLRLWFARPLVDVAALEERMDAVEALKAQPEAAAQVRSALRAVRDPARLLVRLQGMQSLPDPGDFTLLQESMAAMLRLRGALAELVASVGQGQGSAGAPWHATGGAHSCLLARLAAAIGDDLVAGRHLIASVLDPSQSPDGMCVHYGVSKDLDAMKAQYYGLPDLLARVAEHEAGRLSAGAAAAAAAATNWEVVYLPQMGFVLQVRGALLRTDILEALPDWELAFEGLVTGEQHYQAGGGGTHGGTGGGTCSTSDGVCYSTATTRDLSQRYGDMLPKIQDLEAGICRQVVSRLGQLAPAVRAAAAAAATADCLLSLAAAATELRLVRPRLHTGGALHIKGGRHLLTELLVDTFIPNDTVMGEGEGRVHILTGPNLSGKSCYAKQVAIIAYLAHVGSFVPAEDAEVGLVDRIFTRVATHEAAAVPQSTFLIDLSQVGAMLRLATARSLLIIDEFGKGTLAADGVALLCAATAHLTAPRPCGSSASGGAPACPRVLLCTHYTEVLDPVLLPRCPQLAFYTMGVLVEGSPAGAAGSGATPPTGASLTMAAAASEEGEDLGRGLVFLYRLTPGHVAPSFGLHCAKAAGVEAAVLRRAAQVIRAYSKGEAAPVAEAQVNAQQRGEQFRSLVQQLLSMDVGKGEECRGLLGAVVAAVAEA